MVRFLALLLLFANLACHKKEPEVEKGKTIDAPWNWQSPQSRSLNLTGKVSGFAGFPGDSSSTDGFGSYATFKSPTGVTSDGSSLFVSDGYSGTIRKIDIATAEVTTLAGLSGDQSYADGVGSDARFDYPFGIVTDGTHVFVTDISSATIRMINISTKRVSTLAGVHRDFDSVDGIGSLARFSSRAPPCGTRWLRG